MSEGVKPQDIISQCELRKKISLGHINTKIHCKRGSYEKTIMMDHWDQFEKIKKRAEKE